MPRVRYPLLSLSSLLLLPLLLLLLSPPPFAHAIEIKWTPADGEGTGPMPASKKYRDQLERLEQLEAEQAQRDREREAAAAAAPRRSSGNGGLPPSSSSPPPPQVLRQQQQQQQQQQVGLISSLFLGIRRNPLTTATLLASSFAYFNVRRAAQQTGCIVSKSPYLTIWEPPVSYLARLLNDELPSLSPSSSLPSFSRKGSPASFECLHRYRSKKEKEKKGRRGEEGEREEGVLVRQSLAVGKGEVVYRKAAGLVRTLRLLDAASPSSSPSSSSSLGNFYSSERGEEGVFVVKKRMVPGEGREGGRGGGGGLGQWMLMPVRIAKREGRVVVGKEKKSKKKGKKSKKDETAEEGDDSSSTSSTSKKTVEALYEEVILRSLPGCPWTGELRLSASWRQAGGKGGKGDDEVLVEVAWFTPRSSPPSLPPSFQQQVAARLLQEAQALMEREMTMHMVRERQQKQLASDAKAAALERRKKERQLLLHPPPDKKKWAKLQRHPTGGGGGGGGEKAAGRWQPSADLAARRNPRKGG